MKKLLYLVTSSGWGGAERYVARLAKDAVRVFDVTVLAGDSPAPRLFEALPPGVRSGVLPGLTHPIAPFKDLRAVFALRRLIDAEGFDIIHCNSSKAGLIGALAAAWSKKKPKVVYTAHGWGFLERRSPVFTSLILWSEKLAARHRSATIVLSEMERRVAIERGLSIPEKLHLIPHGIDTGEITFLDQAAARVELLRLAGASPAATNTNGFIFGTIANAYAAKALPLMVEAFGKAGLPDARLVILGDGPRMDEVRAAREASPAKDWIFLPGAVADAARLLKGFDAFVLSSVKEGLPWVILEASLAGVPIVATKVGAIPEIIHEGEGVLVPPGDVAALANAMRSVATDETLRMKLKTGTPRIAERRSGFRMSEETLLLYQRLLG